jgi:hypothetical protein
VFDDNDAALLALLAEWTSARDFDTRVNNLLGISPTADRANGDFFLVANATVLDDFEPVAPFLPSLDALTGGIGHRDLFFSFGPRPDRVVNAEPGDRVVTS